MLYEAALFLFRCAGTRALYFCATLELSMTSLCEYVTQNILFHAVSRRLRIGIIIKQQKTTIWQNSNTKSEVWYEFTVSAM